MRDTEIMEQDRQGQMFYEAEVPTPMGSVELFSVLEGWLDL
jgi:hypothetical protein